MKIVHKNKMAQVADEEVNNWKVSGRQLEQQGEDKKAIGLYEAALKKYPVDVYLYNRLMILYRKQKFYKKELALITLGIKKFSALLHPNRHHGAIKIASLSKSILQAVGLSDKKGLALYQPQPIARWEKRKKTASRKLAAAQS
ncbi:MAG: hypothetical protein ABI813_03595 [Bacteroidota bacterium]